MEYWRENVQVQSRYSNWQRYVFWSVAVPYILCRPAGQMSDTLHHMCWKLLFRSIKKARVLVMYTSEFGHYEVSTYNTTYKCNWKLLLENSYSYIWPRTSVLLIDACVKEKDSECVVLCNKLELPQILNLNCP